MEHIITRICSKCKIEQPIENFYKDKRARGGRRANCKSCQIKSSSRYQKDNCEKRKKYLKKYYLENRDYAIEQAKKWYQEHKEERNAWHKEYKKSHKEQYREYQRRADKKRKKESLIYRQQWRDKNRDKWNEYNRTRRAKRRGSEGKITAEERKNLFNKYGNRCLRCGRKDVELTIDHIIPIKLHGLNVVENAQPLCRSCNSKKGIKTTDYRKY